MNDSVKEYVTHPRRWLGIRPWKRHSLVLMVAGTVYAAVGGAFIFSTSNPDREEAIVLALEWMPLRYWGVVWVLAGVLAIISSRWPPIAETWGYVVLTGLSAGWAAFYVMGVIFADSPESNLTGGLVWGLMAFLWWAISGLVNPQSARVVITDGPR